MIAVATELHDLRRWIASAAVVVGLHAALMMTLTRWHEPVEGDEGTDAVLVDLAPFVGPSTETKNDLAPGPVEEQSQPNVEKEQANPTETPKEDIEPPPSADAAVQIPREENKPAEKRVEPTPPVLETAPARPHPSAAQIASWHRKVAQQIERHKGYPAPARSRHETGVAELAFTIDRQGAVLASRIVKSSGSASLDQETISTVKRAEPFPQPPANMPGDRFDFTVPIKFNIR